MHGIVRAPYDFLATCGQRFPGRWLPSSGHPIGPGGTFEIYRNDPINRLPKR